MTLFAGSIRLPNDATSMDAEIQVDSGRLIIGVDGHLIGDWMVSEVAVEHKPNGIVLQVEDEELIVSPTDKYAFSDALNAAIQEADQPKNQKKTKDKKAKQKRFGRTQKTEAESRPAREKRPRRRGRSESDEQGPDLSESDPAPMPDPSPQGDPFESSAPDLPEPTKQAAAPLPGETPTDPTIGAPLEIELPTLEQTTPETTTPDEALPPLSDVWTELSSTADATSESPTLRPLHEPIELLPEDRGLPWPPEDGEPLLTRAAIDPEEALLDPAPPPVEDEPDSLLGEFRDLNGEALQDVEPPEEDHLESAVASAVDSFTADGDDADSPEGARGRHAAASTKLVGGPLLERLGGMPPIPQIALVAAVILVPGFLFLPRVTAIASLVLGAIALLAGGAGMVDPVYTRRFPSMLTETRLLAFGAVCIVLGLAASAIS